MEVGKGWWEREKGVTVNRYGASFGDDENVPKLMVVMVAQFCEYTKKHLIVHLKRVFWPLPTMPLLIFITSAEK